MRDDAGLVAFGEEEFDGLAAAIAVVERGTTFCPTTSFNRRLRQI